jgi:hypothetical protein
MKLELGNMPAILELEIDDNLFRSVRAISTAIAHKKIEQSTKSLITDSVKDYLKKFDNSFKFGVTLETLRSSNLFTTVEGFDINKSSKMNDKEDSDNDEESDHDDNIMQEEHDEIESKEYTALTEFLSISTKLDLADKQINSFKYEFLNKDFAEKVSQINLTGKIPKVYFFKENRGGTIVHLPNINIQRSKLCRFMILLVKSINEHLSVIGLKPISVFYTDPSKDKGLGINEALVSFDTKLAEFLARLFLPDDQHTVCTDILSMKGLIDIFDKKLFSFLLNRRDRNFQGLSEWLESLCRVHIGLSDIANKNIITIVLSLLNHYFYSVFYKKYYNARKAVKDTPFDKSKLYSNIALKFHNPTTMYTVLTEREKVILSPLFESDVCKRLKHYISRVFSDNKVIETGELIHFSILWGKELGSTLRKLIYDRMNVKKKIIILQSNENKKKPKVKGEKPVPINIKISTSEIFNFLKTQNIEYHLRIESILILSYQNKHLTYDNIRYLSNFFAIGENAEYFEVHLLQQKDIPTLDSMRITPEAIVNTGAKLVSKEKLFVNEEVAGINSAIVFSRISVINWNLACIIAANLDAVNDYYWDLSSTVELILPTTSEKVTTNSASGQNSNKIIPSHQVSKGKNSIHTRK